jgi:N-acylmannosamine kinase/N-acetylmannosamine-6-phosphate 2-epimerase/N-acetylmannosamine kinase
MDDIVSIGLAVSTAAPAATGRVGRGRPNTLFRFSFESAYVAGVDIGGESTRLALATLDGRVKHFMRIPTIDLRANLTDSLAAALKELLALAEPAPLASIGIGVPSTVNADGVLVHPWRIKEWEGLGLAAELSEAMQCDVRVHQDNHLAALAEASQAGTAPGSDSVVVIELGAGIGVGAQLGHDMLLGVRGAFGRIMNWPCAAPPGFEGDEATLGECLVASGLLEQYGARAGVAAPDKAADLFDAAERHDDAARTTLEWAATVLNTVVRQVALLIDPATVVIGGRLGRALFEAMPDQVRHHVPTAIESSVLGEDAVLRGGIILAQENLNHWLAACIESAEGQ